MKKLIIPILFVVVFAGCGTAYPNEISVYKFDTAVIQYQFTGSLEGEGSLYLRGDQKAFYKSFGGSNTLELDFGGSGYIVDVDKTTAIKVENADYETLKGLSETEQEVYLVKKALGLKSSAADPEPVTKKVIAGQTCNVYTINNIGSACIWNGIVLETEVTIQDITNRQVAVSVQENVEIPDIKFELPVNVIVK